ncbi:NAD(P)-dependent alcohol dehydrogenase [Flagellimonas myxillae]|uniref:NAD(P)-dependent alcohol dehydrogenase n=1 Tax=Flagellimonas myxillae TaxID=2942214 RepID=UPI00201F103E|nr:NAD(P)-dependent alcohol dehydrogenase [Muricauda myxillae]MCL6265920.1 NAD(P)-dependent alcohol dehydrogenase [Muricauda myxillae]
MKAIFQTSYGHPEEVLQLQEFPTPLPKEKEVQISIKATTVNDYDWAMVTGKPFLYRLMFGLFKPKKNIPGMELAGIVTQVGSQVKDLKIGDKVFGDISDHGFGTFATHLCVNEKAVRKIPEGLDLIDAAALPHASLLALQAWDKVVLQKGQKVLINGGGGGVGSFALQLAKLKDCEVTGVDSERKLEQMLALGFDHVIDYSKSDFTKNKIQYDHILDCKSTRSAFTLVRSLAPKGNYITVGGKVGSLLSLAIWGRLASLITGKRFQILALKPNLGLEKVSTLWLQGMLKCPIDGPHPFEELPRLVQYFGTGKHHGKIVVNLDKT